MTNESIFSLASAFAMVGWVVLLATPWTLRWTQLVSGRIIPLVLCVGYTALVAVNWSSAEGGFDSLSNVAKLFANKELLLAGWIHYLAFDLFVGAWIAADSKVHNIRFPIVIPCLACTFLFGPVGLLLWFAIRTSFRPATVFTAS